MAVLVSVHSTGGLAALATIAFIGFTTALAGRPLLKDEELEA